MGKAMQYRHVLNPVEVCSTINFTIVFSTPQHDTGPWKLLVEVQIIEKSLERSIKD
jgi:hypothetical protein